MIAHTFSPLAALASLLPVPQEPATTAPKPSVAWQRSLTDALAEQQRTGLPLLVVVNMDGEVFNDRFRMQTYRDAGFVTSTAGYVCVLASPDRHTETDYDALGNRVECPRFPGCTCSEHIANGPVLFQRFYEGKTNAPRHTGIAPDGKVLFDRYLDRSMSTAIEAIAEHRGTPTADDALPTETGALLARRDAAARRALEQRYRDGDAKARLALIAAAGEATSEPFDLLRMPLRDPDDAVFAAAAKALAKCATTTALIDVEDALARTGDDGLRAALIARLGELGKTDAVAARLAAHVAPLAAADQTPWQGWQALSPQYDGSARDQVEAELDRCEGLLRNQPDDAALRLRLAVAQLQLGELLAQTRDKATEFWLGDAANSAQKVVDGKDELLTPRAKAVVAIAAWLRSDTAAAGAAIAEAMAAPRLQLDDPWLPMRFLEVVAQVEAVRAYERAKGDAKAILEPELRHVRQALAALAGGGSEAAQLAGIGLLEYVGDRQPARGMLRALVDRFPASPTVHERWRTRLLVDLGTERMLREYATWAAQAPDQATAQWFVGYAAIVAGEQDTRDHRSAAAIAAYTASIDAFAKSSAGNADFRDSADHFAVLALAGRAQAAHDAGDGKTAVRDLLRAAELRPASLDADDGLKRKPRAIALRIARELRERGEGELADQLAPLKQ